MTTELGITPGGPASVPEERGAQAVDAAAASLRTCDIKFMAGSQLRS